MGDFIESSMYKLRFFFVGLLLLASFVLLSLLLSSAGSILSSPSQANTTATSQQTQIPNQNVVAENIGRMAGWTSDTLSSTGRAVVGAATATGRGIGGVFAATGRAIGGAVKSTGSAIASGAKLIGSGIYNGLAFTFRGVGTGFGLVFGSIGRAFTSITKAPVVSAVIRPEDTTELPVINPYESNSHLAAHNTVSEETKSESKPESKPQPAASQNTSDTPTWPIKGRVTTLFGVPHWPWQPTHTGIDISSGNGSGVVAIKPFSAGKVVSTVKSYSGLGNHVIVDHGGGITSVYAHMYSISVTTGQQVTKDTVLGYEGSTGASTGTHLHFEVRVNGQPVNPYDHINGQP